MQITPAVVDNWKNQTLTGQIVWIRFRGQMCCLAQLKSGGLSICKYSNASGDDEILLGILKENQSLDNEFIIGKEDELFQPLASLYDLVHTEYCQLEPELVMD